MYIRRKVFSLLQDETGEERYFSTTDITLEDAEQRIFSLNEYDDEYEQREYADKEGLSAGQKAAIAGAGTLATAAGALYGAKKGLLGRKAAMGVNTAIMKYTKAGGNLYESAVKDAVKAAKRGDKKAQEWLNKMMKENPSMDKGMRVNIAASKKADGDAAAEQILRKRYAGRQPKADKKK